MFPPFLTFEFDPPRHIVNDVTFFTILLSPYVHIIVIFISNSIKLTTRVVSKTKFFKILKTIQKSLIDAFDPNFEFAHFAKHVN